MHAYTVSNIVIGEKYLQFWLWLIYFRTVCLAVIVVLTYALNNSKLIHTKILFTQFPLFKMQISENPLHYNKWIVWKSYYYYSTIGLPLIG